MEAEAERAREEAERLRTEFEAMRKAHKQRERDSAQALKEAEGKILRLGGQEATAAHEAAQHARREAEAQQRMEAEAERAREEAQRLRTESKEMRKAHKQLERDSTQATPRLCQRHSQPTIRWTQCRRRSTSGKRCYAVLVRRRQRRHVASARWTALERAGRRPRRRQHPHTSRQVDDGQITPTAKAAARKLEESMTTDQGEPFDSRLKAVAALQAAYRKSVGSPEFRRMDEKEPCAWSALVGSCRDKKCKSCSGGLTFDSAMVRAVQARCAPGVLGGDKKPVKEPG